MRFTPKGIERGGRGRRWSKGVSNWNGDEQEQWASQCFLRSTRGVAALVSAIILVMQGMNGKGE